MDKMVGGDEASAFENPFEGGKFVTAPFVAWKFVFDMELLG